MTRARMRQPAPHPPTGRLTFPFKQGKQAHHEGETLDDNPYPARGKERRK